VSGPGEKQRKHAHVDLFKEVYSPMVNVNLLFFPRAATRVWLLLSFDERQPAREMMIVAS
jgi:hypothetical protein